MLGKSAQSVQDVLIKKGLDSKVIEYSASTRTAQEAATAIGCEVAQIVKSLVFKTKHSNKAILVLASGPNRVDEKLITQQVGEDISKADADFTREITGFAIGGIPPFGHKHTIETFIDQDLLKFKEVWAAAGTPNTVFSLDSSSLQNLTQGKIIAIK